MTGRPTLTKRSRRQRNSFILRIEVSFDHPHESASVSRLEIRRRWNAEPLFDHLLESGGDPEDPLFG
ncbi:hypothetical protein [Curtobacterium sp. UNCCL20]|uniref:hypothetical protein n=1 Tax=Curtobacterium sp. UNCCL20 TaxID=1502773 RepID=UPI001113685E|nr:hypothetical protein [Curtobacterium sp. UNCCL20]